VLALFDLPKYCDIAIFQSHFSRSASLDRRWTRTYLDATRSYMQLSDAFLNYLCEQVPGISEPLSQPALDDNDLPPVYSGITKELHFWDRAHLQRDSFTKGYLPAWAGANSSDLLFESSPGYLPTPMAPIRISKMLPNAKIIVILREPSSRALSHWYALRKPTRPSMKFLTAVFPCCDVLSHYEYYY
jgi:hypothetical protein